MAKSTESAERIVNGAEMKLLDEHTITAHGVPSLVLMERAALAAVEALRDESFVLDRVEVLCGPGNNGGDGIAIARLLHLAGHEVAAIFVGDPVKRSEDMRKQQEIAESYGLSILGLADAAGAAVNASDADAEPGGGPTTLIDAIFGIGGARAPAGEFLEAIRYINEKRAAGAKVLAIDIPSGVSADTGETPGEAVTADVTVTFAFKKVGLVRMPGSAHAGRIVVKDIGIYDGDCIGLLG